MPPKPFANRQNSAARSEYDEDGAGYVGARNGGLLGEEDDEDEDGEGEALNPNRTGGTGGHLTPAAAEIDDPLDPYASLARLSVDGFGRGGIHNTGAGDTGYGYAEQGPKIGRAHV